MRLLYPIQESLMRSHYKVQQLTATKVIEDVSELLRRSRHPEIAEFRVPDKVYAAFMTTAVTTYRLERVKIARSDG
jgi:hypothetical protein